MRPPASPLRRLTTLAAGAVIAILLTALAMNALLPADRRVTRHMLGIDFAAFYTAGTFVREGRAADLYNLPATESFQRKLARNEQIELKAPAPFWNPPLYALAIAPLTTLPFGTALNLWWAINAASLAAACWLLIRLLPTDLPPRDRTLLLPLVALSMPAIESFSHGQNSPLSLLLLCAVVTLWRAGCKAQGMRHISSDECATAILAVSSSSARPRRPWHTAHPMCEEPVVDHDDIAGRPPLGGTGILACDEPKARSFTNLMNRHAPLACGAVAGLLAYKPQLAGLLAIVLILTLGWRALAGMVITGATLLLANALLLPGTITAYLSQLPANVRTLQARHAFLWDRHATLKAFWHSLLNDGTSAQTTTLVNILTAASAAVVLAMLATLLRKWRHDRSIASLDRLIAATILATPLLMPYYVDYDLLLLAVPAVLATRMTPAVQWTWVPLYACLAVNAPLTAATGVNVTVPLLLITTAAITLAKPPRRDNVTASIHFPTDHTTTHRAAAA